MIYVVSNFVTPQGFVVSKNDRVTTYKRELLLQAMTEKLIVNNRISEYL